MTTVHQRAERRETFFATVAPKLGDHGDSENGQILIDRMFDAVWFAEQLADHPPVDASDRQTGVRHLQTNLQNLFYALSEQPADAQAAALAAAAETRLGECFNIEAAWEPYAEAHAAGRRRQLVDMLRDEYGDLDGFEHGSAASLLAEAQGPPRAVWGSGHDVLWSSGEPLLIGAGVGAGKTTLAGLLVRALLFGGDVLGRPVVPLAPGKRVLYLALDRPEQIARSLARQISVDQLFTVEERMTIWRGPLPRDAATYPFVLRDLADYHNAHVVVIDSLKDAVRGLAEDRTAADYNDARKRLLSSGRELVELHHLTKGGQDYGSVWLNAGAGSVLRLSGKAGCRSADLEHIKPPAHHVGPLKLTHDRDRGEMTLTAARAKATSDASSSTTGCVDLVDWVLNYGDDGVTAKDAAQLLYGSTEHRDILRAKRALGNASELVCLPTAGGRGAQSRWVYVTDDDDSSGDGDDDE
jgi:hypothetical protein